MGSGEWCCLLSDGCKGLGFAFSQLSNCCIGCCREARAGRDAEAALMSAASCGLHAPLRKPYNRVISTRDIRWHPAPRNWPTLQKLIVPASANRPAVPDAPREPLNKSTRARRVFAGSAGVASASAVWSFQISEPKRDGWPAKARPVRVSPEKPHLARCDTRP